MKTFIKNLIIDIYVFIENNPFKFTVCGYTVIFSTLALYLLITGCAANEVVRTEYVATPVYCDVKPPPKPNIKDDPNVTYKQFVSNLEAILVYADELEMALYCCTGDRRCVTKLSPEE